MNPAEGSGAADWPAISIEWSVRFDVGACDALKVPIWFCRPDGQLICASRLARAEIESQDVLTVASGRLVAADDKSNAALQPAIRCVGESTSSALLSLLLRQLKTESMHRVDVSRMPADHDPGAEAIIVVAMMRRVSPRLSELFPSMGLTKAESEVADLTAQGLSCPDISRLRGVTVSTVRSQLALAYHKLGARNRVGLVNVLLGRIISTSR